MTEHRRTFLQFTVEPLNCFGRNGFRMNTRVATSLLDSCAVMPYLREMIPRTSKTRVAALSILVFSFILAASARAAAAGHHRGAAAVGTHVHQYKLDDELTRRSARTG